MRFFFTLSRLLTIEFHSKMICRVTVAAFGWCENSAYSALWMNKKKIPSLASPIANQLSNAAHYALSCENHSHSGKRRNKKIAALWILYIRFLDMMWEMKLNYATYWHYLWSFHFRSIASVWHRVIFIESINTSFFKNIYNVLHYFSKHLCQVHQWTILLFCTSLSCFKVLWPTQKLIFTKNFPYT